MLHLCSVGLYGVGARSIYVETGRSCLCKDKPNLSRVIGSMPGGHRVDGILAFFMVCLVCSKIGVSKFSKASPVIVMFSFIAIMLTIFSLLPTGYYTVFPKFFTVLNNDPSYLFSLDTWAEAVIVVIR
ncbi:unnamed protein product [Angiostrongylus costaricensis]|uniref:Aa_trans domain-containing protein n=1 Tax=Angiostrongylus costaricensis TaxID=334426 RepID=A0A158PLT6_ANGCS|nr:unnamed protein product [Angiostrongylus costaricensis]